jgi:NTE family protein
MSPTVQNFPKIHHGDSVTLMLSGGGIRFPAFIGALQAIEEKGLNVAQIIGASTGSIVGAMYASGYSPREMFNIAMTLDTRRFKDISIITMFNNFGLCCGNRLERWLESILEGRRFSDNLRIPLHIVATDMLRYQPVMFSSDKFPDVSLAAAATSSSAVPWVFGYRDLIANGRKFALVDGSLMSGVVERGLNRNGKTIILKVASKRTLNHPHHERIKLSNYFIEMLTFGLHNQEKEFMKGGKWKDTILLYCANISPARFWLSELEIDFLYNQGYEQTMTYLEYKWGI